MRSGIPRQRLATLHAAGGDGAIETADEQDEVDVGGEQLPVVAAGGAATQERRPRQQAEHLLVVEGEPVADRDRLDTTSELHRAVSARRADLHRYTVVTQHPSGLRVGPVLGQQGDPTVAPTDVIESTSHSALAVTEDLGAHRHAIRALAPKHVVLLLGCWGEDPIGKLGGLGGGGKDGVLWR